MLSDKVGIYVSKEREVCPKLTRGCTEDFEVTIFLTELSTRHSLLTKQKQFTSKPKLQATGNKLTGWLNTSENPIHIEDDGKPPEVLQEDADEVPELRNIPEVDGPSKRKAGDADADDTLFVSSDDEEFFMTQRERAPKRRKRATAKDDSPEVPEPDGNLQDDKKKLALNTSYDGFSIYGRILCLVVKRKGKRAQPSYAPVGGSQMMEQWVSTQAAQEGGLDDDDDG